MFKTLFDRIFVSYKSTLLGLAAALVVEVVSYFASGTGPAGAPPWVHIIAGLILAPLLAWKDQEQKKGDIIEIKPPPRGFVSVRALVQLLIGALLLSGMASCAFIHKEFGASIGQDELDCAEASLHEVADKFVPQLAVLFATAASEGLAAALAQLEADAVSDLGPAARDGLTCAAKAIVADYEAAHQAVAPAPMTLAVASAPNPAFVCYARAQQYLGQRAAAP